MTDFFILAGGVGKRAAPLTDYLPKVLFPLDGTPLIEHLRGQLLSGGLKQGFINVHHLAPMIRALPLPGLEITYLGEKSLSGNRILSECSGKTGNDLFVINGDTFLEIPVNRLMETLNSNGADGVILVRKKDGLYSSIVTRGNHFYKRDKNPSTTDLMYAGVSVFRNEFLSEFQEENLFDSLERSGGKIVTVEYRGFWLDLGTPSDYFLSNSRFREKRGKKNGNSFSHGVILSGEARVINSIVWSNTGISGTAYIRDSIVTGGLHITSGTYIGKILTRNGQFDLNLQSAHSAQK